jgi:hypothetical protein
MGLEGRLQVSMPRITEAGSCWRQGVSRKIGVQPEGRPYLEQRAAWIRKHVREHMITTPFLRLAGLKGGCLRSCDPLSWTGAARVREGLRVDLGHPVNLHPASIPAQGRPTTLAFHVL